MRIIGFSISSLKENEREYKDGVQIKKVDFITKFSRKKHFPYRSKKNINCFPKKIVDCALRAVASWKEKVEII